MAGDWEVGGLLWRVDEIFCFLGPLGRFDFFKACLGDIYHYKEASNKKQIFNNIIKKCVLDKIIIYIKGLL